MEAELFLATEIRNGLLSLTFLRFRIKVFSRTESELFWTFTKYSSILV